MMTVRSEPTTAKGIMLCIYSQNVRVSPTTMFTYPDALVELDFLLIVLLRVEGVEADVVVNQLFPDLSANRVT